MSATKLDAALALARDGFSVFPLRPNDKRPAIENWQNLATTDESRIRQWWKADPDGNIGISTPRHLVVDVDPRNGGAGSFDALLLTYEWPKTRRSHTQGGGAHVLLSLPDHVFVCNNKGKLGPGIDVKSFGGYIVAPGSTIDGRPYRWANDRPVAMAPQWLIDLCKAPTPRSAAAGKRIVEEDELAIETAFRWIVEQAPDANLGEINDTAYAVACRLFDFGVAEDTAKELMRAWGDGKCGHPLEDSTIDHVVRSAQTYRGNAIGSRHPLAPGFEVVEIAPKSIALNNSNSASLPTEMARAGIGLNHDKFAFVSGDVGADRALTSGSRPLIKGLIDRNTLIVLVGAPGEGKSFIVLDMAYHLGQGLPFAGMRTHKCAVAYVAAEGGEGVFARLAALRAHYRTDLGGVYVLPASVDLLHSPAEAEAIIAAIRRLEAEHRVKVGLVVVDTVARALAGGDENSSQDMGAFIKNLDRIRTGVECAAMGVHHTGKDTTRGARGHSSLLGAVDTELQVRNKVLSATKQRDMDKAVQISFALRGVQIGFDAEGDKITSCYVHMRKPGEIDIELSGAESDTLEAIDAGLGEGVGPFTMRELQTWLSEVTESDSEDTETRQKAKSDSHPGRTGLLKHLKALSLKGHLSTSFENRKSGQYLRVRTEKVSPSVTSESLPTRETVTPNPRV